MSSPVVYGAPPRRRPFAAFPMAIQAIIINAQEEVLLLASPTKKPGGWQVISGGLEANETIIGGTLREIKEEAGEGVMVRPLGTVHAHTFYYDDHIPHMLSVYSLFAYEGGEIVPGDDMAGSDWRWWQVTDLFNSGEPIHPSTDYKWLLNRAVELYRLWHNHPDLDEISQLP